MPPASPRPTTPELAQLHPPTIGDRLAAALKEVESRFDEHLRSDLPPVQGLVEHIERYRGKMIRPSLVVICGEAGGKTDMRHQASGMGESPESPASGSYLMPDASCHPVSPGLIPLAAVTEMIHMATLVHDDVLDEADTRRRGQTVNRLRGNEAAVILGDYLFSAAYHLCSYIPGDAGRRACLEIARTGMTLCAGELLQLHHRGDFSIDAPTYFEIVERKTASLIAAACRLGAMLGGATETDADRFGLYGLKLGVAFQIQDDLLDLTGSEPLVGKPLGRDVELGKLTLPLIHHLRAAPALERGRTLARLGGGGRIGGGMEGRGGGGRDGPGDPDQDLTAADRRAALLPALRATGSIDHAQATARRLVDDAKAALGPISGSEAKDLLLTMADTVVTRDF